MSISEGGGASIIALPLEVASREREGGETRWRVGYTLPHTARKAAGDVNGVVCGMHTAPPQSYLPLLARTTAQEDAMTPHVGRHPASHWWLEDSYVPSSSSPSALFAPCPRSLLLADSGCWLWLQAPTSLNEGRGEEVGFRLQSSCQSGVTRQSMWGVVIHVRGG